MTNTTALLHYHLKQERPQITQDELNDYAVLSAKFATLNSHNTGHPLLSGLWALQDNGYKGAVAELKAAVKYLETNNTQEKNNG